MLNFKKNKKGVEVAWGTIIMIIAVVASVIIIIWVLKSSASKVDEELQVDLCRISNEILVGTEEASPWYLHGHSPRVCSTIWRTDKDLQIPTAKYKEKYANENEADKKAAEAEVMDLIAKCWYEWLEGSKENVFPKTGIGPIGRLMGGGGCYICYVFKLNEKGKDFSTSSLEYSMLHTPYFARDSSDKCATNGGFLVTDSAKACLEGEVVPGSPNDGGWKKASLNKDGKACCVRENVLDECENKGGKCSELSTGKYTNYYPKWSCSKTDQKCYVTDKSYLSYYDYITKGGSRGGMVAIKPPINPETDIIAISFHSYNNPFNPVLYTPLYLAYKLWVEDKVIPAFIGISSLDYVKDYCGKD